MARNQRFIPRPEIADLSRKIIGVLVGVNDEISDASLERMVEAPLRPGSRAIRVALRDLERADPPIHFRRIRSEGWKRMQDRDLVARSEADLKTIARRARRGRKRLGRVRFEILSSSDQLQAARNNTRLAAIEDAAAVTAKRRRNEPSHIPELSDVLRKIKDATGQQ